jgi:hypothetical protein
MAQRRMVELTKCDKTAFPVRVLLTPERVVPPSGQVKISAALSVVMVRQMRLLVFEPVKMVMEYGKVYRLQNGFNSGSADFEVE